MTKPEVTAQEPAEEPPGEIEQPPEVVAHETEDDPWCAIYTCATKQSA